jgi:predicted O-linked N-acetylglucosamine transferase (SPINDLY family)
VAAAEFLQYLALADVMLDRIPSAAATPATRPLRWYATCHLPSEQAPGRITLALCRKMGWADCVVDSPKRYVAWAVHLATDRPYRESICQRIHATSGVLFEDMEEVRALEAFLREAINADPAAQS